MDGLTRLTALSAARQTTGRPISYEREKIMGIRIHKMLGYGLQDVATEDGRIVDPRINLASPLVQGNQETFDGYASFLRGLAEEGDEEAGLELAMTNLLEDQDREVNSLVTWAAEGGMPNVLLVRPLGYSQWSRYDNILDAEEEIALYGATLAPRLKVLEGGIYPFSGLHMDSRTGEKLTEPLASTWKRVKLAKSADADKGVALLDRLAIGLGFGGSHEAEERVVPLVPDSIRWVCEWGEVFTTPDVWRQLRPMLYVYWS